MMKWLILLGIGLFSIDQPEEFTVIAESGLNLRLENSLDSPVLEKLPYGSIIISKYNLVMDLEKSYNRDTVNSIIGYWVDAKYRKGNTEIEGYVFSPYIRRGKLDLKDGEEKPIRIIHEGLQSCSELDYYPGLNWYGFYEKEDGYEIRPIKVEFKFGKWNEEKMIVEYQMIEDASIMLSTSEEQLSMFLIGVMDSIPLASGGLLTLYSSKNSGYTRDENNGFLSVNENISLNYGGVNYCFEGIQKIDKKIDGRILRLYDVLISTKNDTVEVGRYLSESTSIINSTDLHDNFQTPQIRWIGELNEDRYLDFIVYQHTMTEGCGVCWITTLFLGKESTSGLATYAKTDEVEDCNCDF